MTLNAKATSIDAAPAAPPLRARRRAVVPRLYTTGTATAEGGGTRTAAVTGTPFDDDPADGVADCEDWETSAGDVVTVERIAEASSALLLRLRALVGSTAETSCAGQEFC